MSDMQSPTGPAFRDQSTGLTLFGVFQLLLGGFCGLAAFMMLAMATIPQRGVPGGTPMGLRQAIPMAGLYVVMAVAGVLLGIGSIRARRWAWALTLVLSWMWLIVGICALLCWLIWAPYLYASMQQQMKMPPQALLVMQIVMGGMLGCMYILLPGVFLLFYQRSAVRATCRWRDPQTRWTDRCPLPVLAVSLALAYSALQMPFSLAAYGGVIPLFGRFVTGIAASALLLFLCVVSACLAWGMYRLKMVAWWGSVVLCIVGSASATMTFAQPNALKTMYEKMDLPPAQLEMINKMGIPDRLSGGMVWLMPISALLVLGYLVWVRRYFKAGEAERTS